MEAGNATLKEGSANLHGADEREQGYGFHRGDTVVNSGKSGLMGNRVNSNPENCMAKDFESTWCECFFMIVLIIATTSSTRGMVPPKNCLEPIISL